MMLYQLLQISDNETNIHNITKYIKPQLFIKAFPNITYCNREVDENNIQFILEPIQKYLFALIEQKKYFQINIKEKLNNILNEYDAINHALKNDPRIDYSDIYKFYDNEVVLNKTINKNQIYDEYQSFQDWIYTHSAKEIINNKFKIIKYFIPKNIYIEKIRQKTNEISNIGQSMSSTMSSYHQEELIKEILK